MKKLLFIINTLGRAGAEMALIELLRKLSARDDCEISLYVMIPQGELVGALPEGVKVLNDHISDESVLSSKGRAMMMRQVLKRFFYKLTGFKLMGFFIKNTVSQLKSKRFQPDKLLWRLISEGTPPPEEHYDLCVAYLEGAATYYAADKVSASHKAAFVHIDYQKAGYTPLMDQGCYDKMDKIFTVSNEVGNRFLDIYPEYKEKVCLFHNFLNVDLIRQKAKNGEGFTDEFDGTRLVTVGRLHYQKGYDVAIKALKLLINKGLNVRWYILGEGPERASLEKMISEEGLEDRFILMGAKSNPYPYVDQADIYVHATRFEGKSIAIEEAQILGKVIVASDCTGNTEQIIPEYDGVLLTLSAETLADELERVMKDEALRNKLRENVLKKNFEHDEDLEKLMSLTSISKEG